LFTAVNVDRDKAEPPGLVFWFSTTTSRMLVADFVPAPEAYEITHWNVLVAAKRVLLSTVLRVPVTGETTFV
jgi:hypothetical protein